ncbi:MAG: NADH-quinone oxidoreductase subunit M, partial [Myxococcota bacterium]|nr:NADH-quinone oxidoreductase subunit M [Myxococcota bacterium]
GGLGAEAPRLGAMAGVGLLVSLGVPGAAGFWGAFLSLVGGFVRHPVLALLLAGCFVILAAAHFRVARLVLLGRLDAGWRRSALLEPLGGRVPDATARELAALAPVAAMALLLGLYPAPLFSSLAGAVRDVSFVADPAGLAPQNGDAR